MIGVSLSYKWMLTGVGGYGLDLREVLTELKRREVDSIELRTVLPGDSPEGVLSVAERLWNFGFGITVHSRMHSAETAVSDVFDPLRLLIKNLRQESLVLVLHPINADNIAILRALSDHITENNYPVTVALENNRLMPDNSEGDAAAYVLDTVKAVDRPNIRICFDMGHYMYYVKKHRPDAESCLPPEGFIKRIVHTHIHALSGLKTHFPLTEEYELPLSELTSGIGWGYFGVYNFEPDLPRWDGVIDPLPAILSSLDNLRRALPPCAGMYDRIRRDFEKDLIRATEVWQGDGDTRIALANSTFYLFNTDGFKWAMDPALRYARYLTGCVGRLSELFSDVKLTVITHGHVDHFEMESVRELAKCDMLWVIPDFLYDNALEWGIRKEKIVVARPNEPICIDKLTIMPFMGRHFRPITRKGVDEYGYYITAEGQPSMVFPADVRDYSTLDMPPLPKADICFGHIWLGDGNSFAPEHTELAEAQARFLTELSCKHIVLAHLYENGRRDCDMWREEHADEVRDAILRIRPDVRVSVPRLGEHFTP